MDNPKRCEECRGKILPNDRYVSLVTRDRWKVLESAYFHIQCWGFFFNKAVTNRAKKEVSSVQKNIMKVFDNPMLKNLLSGVGGMNQVKGMLETPLIEQKIDYEKKLLEMNNLKKPKKKSVKKKNGKRARKPRRKKK